MDISVAKDDKVRKSPQFHKIIELLNKLEQGGILGRLSGNCVTASDMVQTMLAQVGIESEVVECQACIYRQGEAVEFFFIGYDDTAFAGQVDTHLIVVTKTQLPVLIDVSIGHLLPNEHPYIVEAVQNTTDPNTISEYEYSNFKITYQKKKNIRVPHLHQKTLLSRFADETKTKAMLKKLGWVVWAGIALGLLNFALNITLVSIKLLIG
jgi:hypothetical protein